MITRGVTLLKQCFGVVIQNGGGIRVRKLSGCFYCLKWMHVICINFNHYFGGSVINRQKNGMKRCGYRNKRRSIVDAF